MDWFGESTMSLVSKSSISSIKEGLRIRVKKYINRQLRDAVVEALQEAMNQKTKLKGKTS